MTANSAAEQAKQRAYYAQTANTYDTAHFYENELDFALFGALLRQLDASSVLDIGSGTGRALLVAKECRPDIKVVGIEPSPDLRERGYAKGLKPFELINGDAQSLAFADNNFDVVCEFAALHHIPHPAVAVSEMLRVARKAIFISDVNNFGQGGRVVRAIKQVINAIGLWPLANLLKTRGKGYDFSEGDGVSYSYSAFNDISLLRTKCSKVYIFGDVSAGGSNPYRSSPGAVIVGLKERGSQL